jgi:hypothetical protein
MFHFNISEIKAVRELNLSIFHLAFLGIGTAIEVAFIYYPFFGCLASYHRIIGALMALPYIAL